MSTGEEESAEEFGSRRGAEGESSEEPLRIRSSKLPKLSLKMRVVAFVLGWGLVLVGVAGLALPGIQGVLTLLAGTAVLSVVSETVYRLLRWVFRRWPGGWKRVRGFRRRVHGWLHRKEYQETADSPNSPASTKSDDPPPDP